MLPVDQSNRASEQNRTSKSLKLNVVRLSKDLRQKEGQYPSKFVSDERPSLVLATLCPVDKHLSFVSRIILIERFFLVGRASILLENIIDKEKVL